MSFFRSALYFCRPLIITLFSLLVSAGLFYLGSDTEYEEYKGGYAMLSTDVSVDDKTLCALLNDADFFGGEPVSESSQIVMLDNFDALEAVPLDKYFSRINSFDPRNDGYAGKLREIFIKDDKRIVYVPLKAGKWDPAVIDQKFASLLGDIPFAAGYFAVGRPLSLFFAAYAAASVCLLVIFCVNRKAHRGAFITAALIPVFFPLAFFGASGIGCAALLTALFIFLREPLNDIFMLRKSFSREKQKKLSWEIKRKIIYREIIVPYGFYVLLLPVFAAAFAVLIEFSQLKLFFVLLAFASALLVFLFSLIILSIENGKHKKFAPVMIKKHSQPNLAFSVYMLPMTLAAFAVFFTAPSMPGVFMSDIKFDNFITEQDYYSHLAFQSSFSMRQLDLSNSYITSPPERFHAVKPSFFYDTDGLPSLKITASSQTVNLHDYPPFPLNDLMEFFHNVNMNNKIDSGASHGIGDEKIPLSVLVFFMLFGLLIKTINDNLQKRGFSKYKKMAYKVHKKGINLNKSPLYNIRNQKHLQNGAAYQKDGSFWDRWKILKDA